MHPGLFKNRGSDKVCFHSRNSFLKNYPTCTVIALLGPCFKTGEQVTYFENSPHSDKIYILQSTPIHHYFNLAIKEIAYKNTQKYTNLAWTRRHVCIMQSSISTIPILKLASHSSPCYRSNLNERY